MLQGRMHVEIIRADQPAQVSFSGTCATLYVAYPGIGLNLPTVVPL